MVVDTDTLIRFLTIDDEHKFKRVNKFFKTHENLELTDVTLAEIYWTLSSFYKYPKGKIIAGFRILLELNWFKCDFLVINKTLLILEENNISFIDAYISAYSQVKNDSKIVSFDKGYDRVKGIKRVEP